MQMLQDAADLVMRGSKLCTLQCTHSLPLHDRITRHIDSHEQTCLPATALCREMASTTWCASGELLSSAILHSIQKPSTYTPSLQMIVDSTPADLDLADHVSVDQIGYPLNN